MIAAESAQLHPHIQEQVAGSGPGRGRGGDSVQAEENAGLEVGGDTD